MTNNSSRQGRFGNTRNEEVFGRTWPDLLSALFKRYGFVAILGVSLLVYWVHDQTGPGDQVEIFGIPLWKKGALPPSSSAEALASSPPQMLAAPAAPPHSDSTPVAPKSPAPTVSPPEETPGATAPAPAARSPYAVALPSRREYVVGPKDVSGRYSLLSATVSQDSPESDLLAIQLQVRSTALQGYGTIVNQASFSLLVSGSPLEPERRFTDIVPSGQSMDMEIVFRIQPGLSRAKLRIMNSIDQVDIPLDLIPPGALR